MEIPFTQNINYIETLPSVPQKATKSPKLFFKDDRLETEAYALRNAKSFNTALIAEKPSPSSTTKKPAKAGLSQYLSIAVGTYIRGKWNPAQDCSAFRLCFQNLEGANITATYTKELIKNGVWFLDLDASANLGHRVAPQTYTNQELDDNEGTQFSLALIPMLRVRRLGSNIPIGLGIGVGPSLTFGDRVVDGNERFSPILSRVVNEITFPLDKENNKTLFASLTHDCTFLGILKNKNGLRFGQHWYSAGFRFKL